MKSYYNQRKRKRPKPSTNPYYKVIALVVLFVLAQGYYFNYLISSSSTTINFEITTGENTSSIANRLKDLNIIQSKFLFKRFLSNRALDNKIKTGTFQIPITINLKNLSEILIESPINATKIVIIEGQKISQIEDKHQGLDLNNCLENCNLNNLFQTLNIQQPQSLEGFIYPDTYFLDESKLNSNLVEKATRNFLNKTKELDLTKINKLGISNFYEVLIIASLIEKEVINQDDRELVSGIIHKRLQNNWTLGIDAALLYEKKDNSINYQDLQKDSPYNLRKKLGIPPTPICNPSISSIKAALNPKASNYWFYLTTPKSREVIYSKTNQEHNINKAKYLR